jgi:hypothetical protein
MSFGGGTPSITQTPAPTTSQADLQAQDAERRKRKELQQRNGLASTILTGDQGLTGTAPTAKKTILGQ